MHLWYKHCMTILLIEDDVDLASLWREYLCTKAFDVHICHSVASACIALETLTPSVMVVDYNLSDGTAAEVIKVLQEQGQHDTQVLVCSGQGAHLPRSVLDYGVHILAKPFRLDHLLQTIEALTP